MQALHGWRRVQRDCGRHLADLHKVALVLKGMNLAFLKVWGQEALAVDHHVPFALEHIRLCHEALRSYAVVAFCKIMHDAVCVIMLFSLVRGPRLDEWCEMFSGDTYYRRINFVWVHGRELIGSTQRAMAVGPPRNGWLLRVQNVPSKTDRTGRKLMGKCMWYVLNCEAPLNFAAEWLRWELAYPCPEELRASWPAFSPSGNSVPFKPSGACDALFTLLVHAVGLVLAQLHAWHDFRATIASALKGADQSDAIVQAIVCWASAASVQLYGQLTPELMASKAELATTVDASRHAHLPTPHTGSHSVAAELEDCARAMLETPATRATAPKAKSRLPKAPPVSAPANAAKKSKRRRPPSPALAEAPSGYSATASSQPASPRAAETCIVVHDIGEQYGDVEVDTACTLAGQSTRVLNVAWGAGSGSTECCIVGVARGITSVHGGIYVVQSSDDGLFYPFTAEALRTHLSGRGSRAQRNLLDGAAASAAASSRPRSAPVVLCAAAPATPVKLLVAKAIIRRSPRLLGLASSSP
jgi:hypothetical protein